MNVFIGYRGIGSLPGIVKVFHHEGLEELLAQHGMDKADYKDVEFPCFFNISGGNAMVFTEDQLDKLKAVPAQLRPDVTVDELKAVFNPHWFIREYCKKCHNDWKPDGEVVHYCSYCGEVEGRLTSKLTLDEVLKKINLSYSIRGRIK